jgi:hypothetical protein
MKVIFYFALITHKNEPPTWGFHVRQQETCVPTTIFGVDRLISLPIFNVPLSWKLGNVHSVQKGMKEISQSV